jgi:hypothetical protein
MATIFKSNYDTGATFTCTLAGLANNGARSALAVDNTTNLYLDALVQMQIKSGASGVSATGTVLVYAYGSADGGTSYPESAGTDTGVTLSVPATPNVVLIRSMNVVANATTYISEPASVAGAFGGILPSKWGIIVVNQSGAALDGTEGNHKKLYMGTWVQGV